MPFSRDNRSTRASICRHEIYACGANMNVFKGEYTRGQRKGEECVAKMFKTGSVFEDSYFAVELNVAKEALSVVENFNTDGIIDKTILVNKPEVWRSEDDGENVIVEPFIENFEKFNSNTGWTPREKSPWIEVMQALSHYSYHATNGRLLLCDLQSGVYADGFILTDPVIMSTTREFGPTDLGPDGIATFFSRHKCNRFCARRGWMRPQNVRAHFAAQQGTSMMLCPTRTSRPALTHVQRGGHPGWPRNGIKEEYDDDDDDDDDCYDDDD